MKISLSAALAVLSLLTVAPAFAQSADEPLLLNTPGVGAWNVYGPGQTKAGFKDKDVQGGNAIRITVANSTTNLWDVGMSTSIDKPIKAGDQLIVVVWAKVESQDPNATVTIPAAVGLAAAPYTPVITGNLQLTTQWQKLYFNGVANADYPAGKLNVSLQLGGQPKKVDFGPAFALDEGQ